MNQASSIERLEGRLLLSQYANSGFNTLQFGPSLDQCRVALMAPLDGQKFLVVGTMIDVDTSPQKARVVMAQFDAAGQPASSGITSIIVDRELKAAQAQPDGTLLVLGQKDLNDLVARYTPAGTLDTSFSGDGVVQIPVQTMLQGGGIEFAPDGKVVVLGTVASAVDGAPQPLLARLTSAGELDTTFHSDGIEQLSAVNGAASDLQVLDDGKILVASRDSGGSFLSRYNSDGSIDTTFGDNGVAFFQDFGIASLDVLPDGRILIAAGAESIARLTPTGQLDSSFGDNGVATMISGVRVDQGAKFYIGSDGTITVLSVWGTSRFTADGNQDHSYGLGRQIDADHAITTYGLPGPYLFPLTVAELTDNQDVLLSGNDPGNVISTLRLTYHDDVYLDPINGDLAIAGTADPDTIVVQAVGDQVQVTRNADIKQFPATQVRSVSIDSGDGNDSISVLVAVRASITAGAGDDTVISAEGNTSIDAGDGNDSISTGAGRDAINAGAGNDSVNSGAGDDFVSPGFGNDTVVTGDGNDSVSVSGGTNIIDTGAGNDSVTAHAGANSITGSDGDDYLVGGDGNDTLLGGDGNDTIRPGEGDNFIDAGTGNDSIKAVSGNDAIYAGDGMDSIFAGDGDNLVYGGDGDDYIQSGTGSDTIWGDVGYDSIKAGLGDDLINGGAGKDHIWGQQGNDRIYGRRGNDALDGGPDDDRLVGDDNQHDGGDGYDKFFGSDGNDVIYARNNDADFINGGSGTDTCVADESLDQMLDMELMMP